MTSRLPFVTTILVLGSVSNAFTQYHVSVAEAQTPGSGVLVEESVRTMIRLDSLNLGLLALDATPSASKVPWAWVSPQVIPSLMIRFEFETAALGYSFNPMLVSVRTAEGGVLHPVAYVGPGQVMTQRDPGQRYCRQPGPGFLGSWDPVELPARLESEFMPLPLKRSCFVVSFDIVVGVEGHVDLTIEGIARGAEPLAIPAFALSRRTVRGWFEQRPSALDAMAFDHRFGVRWIPAEVAESFAFGPRVLNGVDGELIVDARSKEVRFAITGTRLFIENKITRGTKGQIAFSTPFDKVTVLGRWEGDLSGGWRGYLTIDYAGAAGRRFSEIVVFRNYPGYYLPAALETLEALTGLKAQERRDPARQRNRKGSEKAAGPRASSPA